jgi:hypothetical protein
MRRLFNIENPLVQWKSHANVSSLAEDSAAPQPLRKVASAQDALACGVIQTGHDESLAWKRFYPLKKGAAEGIPVGRREKTLVEG